MDKPRNCPNCGSDMVDYTKIDFTARDNKCISAHGYCHSCKAHFDELYSTSFIATGLCKDDPYAGPAGAPVTQGTPESYKPKATLKRVPHRHVYEYYRTCSSGMSPDAGVVWEEWRCNRNGCGDIIRRNERVLEDQEWWNR